MKDGNKLFRYFGLKITESRSIRQISLDTKIPYMSLNRLVKELEKQNLIKAKKIGKSIVCSLNMDNKLTKQHLILASEDYKNCFLERRLLIKRVAKVIEENKEKEFSAVLFGSYAFGNEQKHSDVDIAFISDSKLNKIKSELKTIEQIHDIEINAMIFTKKQFLAMLRAKEENVGKQILKNHVVLRNPELFWSIIYEVLA